MSVLVRNWQPDRLCPRDCLPPATRLRTCALWRDHFQSYDSQPFSGPSRLLPSHSRAKFRKRCRISFAPNNHLVGFLCWSSLLIQQQCATVISGVIGGRGMGTDGRITHYKFKIGQTVHYEGRGRIGAYVIIAVLPQVQDDVRYRIRSENDPSLEYVASERDLKPISRTHRRLG
jgi:hypothetical protein